MVAAEGVWQDLLAAGVGMAEGPMIGEEGMIVDTRLGADIVEGIAVDLGATLHTESLTGKLDGRGHYNITDERKDLKEPQSHRSGCRDLYSYMGRSSKELKSSVNGSRQEI